MTYDYFIFKLFYLILYAEEDIEILLMRAQSLSYLSHASSYQHLKMPPHR